MSTKWSIRNVTPEARAAVREVTETSNITFGEAVTEAILFWYRALPELDEDEEPEDRGSEGAGFEDFDL